VSRYYFDIHDSTSTFDDVGAECATLDDVRVQAIKIILDIARDQALAGNDRLTYTVLASDEDHRAVYSATLSLVGLWLIR
jgi:hypothetical protein